MLKTGFGVMVQNLHKGLFRGLCITSYRTQSDGLGIRSSCSMRLGCEVASRTSRIPDKSAYHAAHGDIVLVSTQGFPVLRLMV